jgi:hypothetical protein
MVDRADNNPSLIRGCALFADSARSPDRYFLGTINRVAVVTSAFQRSALLQLAQGQNPLVGLIGVTRDEVSEFLLSLSRAGFLVEQRRELQPPKRYLSEVDSRDLAANQFRARANPELAQSEWIDGKSDGGASTIAARGRFPVELSGRSRVITLLYSILLASGLTRVRFADRHFRSAVGALDIGCGAIGEGDLGLNYYEALESRRRHLSLFPIEVGQRYDLDISKPAVTIHYGDCDPEEILEWSHARRPYLLIHAPIGDEIAIGPLVLPGQSPCARCHSLFEIDNWGFTRVERIPLTPVDELPMATAHYVAAVVAGQILHFIDSLSEGSEVFRNTSIGEVTYVNFQKLTEPQVVAISRHPLCGCDR